MRRTASGWRGGVANPVAGADAAEQRSCLPFGGRLPGVEGPDGAGLDMAAARQADLGPLPCLVGLAAPDPELQPAGNLGNILDPERHKFRAPQGAGETEEQQRPVPPPARAYVTGGQQLAQDVEREGGGLRDRPTLRPQQPVERPANVAVRRVPGQVVEAVHLAQGREPAADGGRRLISQAGEIGADNARFGRHRHEAHRRAPGGIMRPVGAVGAERGGGVGIAGERSRFGKSRPARLCQSRLDNPRLRQPLCLGRHQATGAGIRVDHRRRGRGFNHSERRARLDTENKPNISLTRDKGGYHA
jgi:hypothetical protein